MEVEIKYSVPDELTIKRIAAQHNMAAYTIGEISLKRVQDRYLDTADLRFYRAGYSCRIRKQEEVLLVTLKSTSGNPQSGALHRREEVETHASGDQPETWEPSVATDLANQIAGGKKLVELFQLKQTRRVGIIFDDDREVAELSLDRVQIQTGKDKQFFYELEAELREGGQQDDLDNLGKFLEQEYSLEPQPRSKFERALIILRPDVVERIEDEGKKTPGVLPADSMVTAARKIIAFNTPKMIKKEKGTISGDADDLHDMRVATRRMRGAARVFSPFFTDDELTKLGRQLKSTASALGAVRDLDVQIEQAQKFNEKLPAEEQSGFTRLLESWDEERADARDDLVQLLESNEYKRLKKRLGQFSDTEDESVQFLGDEAPVPYRVQERAGSDIWEHFEQVLAFAVVADNPSDTQIHQLRINCKYLRYVLEFFEEALPADAGGIIAQLAQLQDQLGSFHDATVTMERLLLFLKHAKKAKRDSTEEIAGIKSYMLDRQNAISDFRAHLPETWATLSGQEFRQRLANLLANIGVAA